MAPKGSIRAMPWRQQVLHQMARALNMQVICKEGWCMGADYERCRKMGPLYPSKLAAT